MVPTPSVFGAGHLPLRGQAQKWPEPQCGLGVHEQRGASRVGRHSEDVQGSGPQRPVSATAPRGPGDCANKLSQAGLTGWVLPSLPQAAPSTSYELAPGPGSGVQGEAVQGQRGTHGRAQG